MNGRIFRSLALTITLFLFLLPVLSQRNGVKIHSLDADSIDCGVAISAYRTFYREELYDIAQPTWLRVFNECPDSSERIYVDGVTMYRSFIESTTDGSLREVLIDTLMLIYDRRMQYFGGEGNVLGRKGTDLLNYRGSDMVQVQQANDMLRKSIELQGQESQEAVMRLCILSDVVLNREGLMDEAQIIADYVMVTGNLLELEKGNSRWQRIRSNINETLLKESLLSCSALDIYYEPLMEDHETDTAFLETIISSYSPLQCDHSTVIAAASEILHLLSPDPESAHSLALQFIAGNDLKRAAAYLEEALKGEYINDETRAQWYYELAVVSHALEDYCLAIAHARESIKLDGNSGKVYQFLGDAIISSRKDLGGDFQKRTAYWAAADMYETAISVDPALEEEVRKKLLRCVAQFPDKEDIFFRDIREGEAYLVEGCIDFTTTVRCRK